MDALCVYWCEGTWWWWWWWLWNTNLEGQALQYSSSSLLNWPRLLNTVTWNETRLAYQFISHPAHLTVYHTTGVYAPYTLQTALWVLLCPTRIKTVKELWDRAYGFSALSERTNVTTKAAQSPQTLQDSECWSCWGLDPWPPAQHTGTYPIIYWANRAAIFLWSFTYNLLSTDEATWDQGPKWYTV